jgi:hypothetical protein
MRAFRRWIRKVRCRAKYGRACPHGGHVGGRRRNSVTAAQTNARKPSKEEQHHAPAHRADKRLIDRARADA